MKRGELYRVRKPGGDPKRSRVFAVIGRRAVIDSSHSTVICAPVFTRHHGLSTQVPVGLEEGLKHEGAISCDALMSVPKAALSDYVGTLRQEKIHTLNQALVIAVGLDDPSAVLER